MRRAAAALLSSLALCGFAAERAAAPAFTPVTPGKALSFPRDAGAHPDFRIEWWYVTGHLESAGRALGFQVTFFRVRNPPGEALPGRFSPGQLLFAHAALADPATGRLLRDERAARLLEGLVSASPADTDVRLDDWSLRRDGARYVAHVPAAGFSLDLALEATQPPLLQGERGFSRKGPSAANASYYYSEPQLRVTGTVTRDGKAEAVGGVAWLDHEWSSELLAEEATGWDWIGANLDDGAALMAFRMRRRDGTTLWSVAALRARDGTLAQANGDDVAFTPGRTWRSARTGVTYPVSMQLRMRDRSWTLEPLMDDQELDARASTGTLYWEGAVRLRSAQGGGRGYLELTGYGEKLRF